MPSNAFINKAEPPTDADLAAALGSAKQNWDATLESLEEEFGVDIHEWRCYSRKSGWSLKAKRKDRTIVWLSPHEGSFTAMFILGDKAVRAARKAELPPKVIKALADAKKYPEGTGVRLEPKGTQDFKALRRLAAIKLAN